MPSALLIAGALLPCRHDRIRPRQDIKKQALSILHAEAMRSFSRGSEAAADFVEAYLKRASRS